MSIYSYHDSSRQFTSLFEKPSIKRPLDLLVRLSANFSEIRLPYLDDVSLPPRSPLERSIHHELEEDKKSTYDIEGQTIGRNSFLYELENVDATSSYYAGDDADIHGADVVDYDLEDDNVSISQTTLAMSTSEMGGPSTIKNLKEKNIIMKPMLVMVLMPLNNMSLVLD